MADLVKPLQYAAIVMMALIGALICWPRMVEHSVQQVKWSQEQTHVARR